MKEIKDALVERPQWLNNVLVCYEDSIGQPFWTRGFLQLTSKSALSWCVMLWDHSEIVPFDKIRYWTELPTYDETHLNNK